MFHISLWLFFLFVILHYFKLTRYNPLFLLLIGYFITYFEFIYLIINKIITKIEYLINV
uniref:Uncharacterized protein n=1 Tax=viral metagenome TaxID=1070528 RepID=A0A6C0DLV5_9ZZZZ